MVIIFFNMFIQSFQSVKRHNNTDEQYYYVNAKNMDWLEYSQAEKFDTSQGFHKEKDVKKKI